MKHTIIKIMKKSRLRNCEITIRITMREARNLYIQNLKKIWFFLHATSNLKIRRGKIGFISQKR